MLSRLVKLYVGSVKNGDTVVKKVNIKCTSYDITTYCMYIFMTTQY